MIRMPQTQPARSGFTRLELVTVTATTLFFLAFSLARAGRASINARATLCLANQRELAAAWTSYALDHTGTLVNASAGFGNSTNAWVAGYIDETSAPSNFDPALSIERGQLWPYTRRIASIFRCPEDSSGRIVAGQRRLRVRSYSMNLMISHEGDGGSWNSASQWMIYTNKSQVDSDLPAARFILADEHPASINDGELVVSMTGYPNRPTATFMVDFPASYHEGAGALVFADEHAEIHAWADFRTSPPYTGNPLSLNVPQPSNPDIRWLQERTTRSLKP